MANNNPMKGGGRQLKTPNISVFDSKEHLHLMHVISYIGDMMPNATTDHCVVTEHIENPPSDLLQVLIPTFARYLDTRLPYHDQCCKNAILFVAKVILSLPGMEAESSFEPAHLWKFLETNSRIDILATIHSALRFYCRINIIDGQRMDLNIIHLSYFGEFLFLCSGMDPDGRYPVTTIEGRHPEEIKLLEDIRTTITPELGILYYISFKNWVSFFDRNYRIQLSYQCSVVFDYKTKAIFWQSYKLARGKIRGCRDLYLYYNNFRKYLRTKLGGFYRRFTDSPFHLELSKQFNIQAMVFSYDDDYLFHFSYRLLKKCFMDILTFIYSLTPRGQQFELSAFRFLPKYIESRSKLKNSENVTVILLTCSKLLDFLFVEHHWRDGFLPVYLNICKEVEKKARRCFPQKRLYPCHEFCWFPFYRKT